MRTRAINCDRARCNARDANARDHCVGRFLHTLARGVRTCARPGHGRTCVRWCMVTLALRANVGTGCGNVRTEGQGSCPGGGPFRTGGTQLRTFAATSTNVRTNERVHMLTFARADVSTCERSHVRTCVHAERTFACAPVGKNPPVSMCAR